MAPQPPRPVYSAPEGSTAPAYRLPAYGSPLAEPPSPVREPPKPLRTLRLPAVDDRLADPQCQLAYLGRACVADGYVASTELLTRTDREYDFATDVCVHREGTDPETGGRYPEEISFEVASAQSAAKLKKRVEKLVARGVRRVFGMCGIIHLQTRRNRDG